MTSKSSEPASTGLPLRVELTAAPAITDSDVLMQFAFGGEAPDTVAHAGLEPLAGGPVYEIWRAPNVTEQGQHELIHWRANGQLLFGAMSLPLKGDGVEVTRDAYQRLFDCTTALRYPELLRIWNFMPGINQGDGDSEFYKRFCTGRATVFDDTPGATARVSAATAIGRRGSNAGNELVVYFLAARTPGLRLENPRQTSAPDYPRQYGPRSPQFARATVWPNAETQGAKVLLVSGTASIVGHETRHIGNLGLQLEETWANLEQLRGDSGADRALAMRVYIRHESDFDQVSEFIRQRTSAETAVLYLHADICRAELLLEIEAVYQIPHAEK